MTERLAPVTIEYDPWVYQIRNLIENIVRYDAEGIVAKAAELFEVDLGQRLDPNTMRRWKEGFYMNQIEEIDEECATAYTQSLFEKLQNRTVNEMLLSATRVYYDSMSAVAPVLVSFWDCVLEKCRENRIRTIVVAGTDGNPLYVVGRQIAKRHESRAKIILVELTRKAFGIYDEIAAKVEPTKTSQFEIGRLLKQLARSDFGRYLQAAIPMDKVALVDAEAYGSVISLLIQLGWRLWVFLLASNNPFLSGYLNVVTEYMNMRRTVVSELFPWHVGDSIEAFPRPYKVEKLERVDRRLYVREKRPSPLYGVCGLLAYWALAKRTRDLNAQELDIQQSILRLSSKLQTGEELSILSSIMPEWSGAWKLVELWVKERLGFVKPRPELIATSVFGKR